MNDLTVFNGCTQTNRILEKHIRDQESNGVPVQILEAGCGRQWELNLSGIQCSVTGVDMDAKALEIRKEVLKDLTKTIVGDLHTVNLPNNQYDIIYSGYVLEHVARAEQMMQRLCAWLKPGGILILRFPDRNSVFGLISRSTAFWFHVFYQKHIMGRKTAGTPGHGPYPTYHDKILSREGIKAFCRRNDLEIKEEIGQNEYLRKQKRVTRYLRPIVRLIAWLSFGRLKWKHNNLTYVLKKKAPILSPV